MQVRPQTVVVRGCFEAIRRDLFDKRKKKTARFWSSNQVSGLHLSLNFSDIVKDLRFWHPLIFCHEANLAPTGEVDEDVAERHQVILTACCLEFKLILCGEDYVAPEDINGLLFKVIPRCVPILLRKSKINEPYLMQALDGVVLVPHENVIKLKVVVCVTDTVNFFQDVDHLQSNLKDRLARKWIVLILKDRF